MAVVSGAGGFLVESPLIYECLENLLVVGCNWGHELTHLMISGRTWTNQNIQIYLNVPVFQDILGIPNWIHDSDEESASHFI